LEVAPLKLSLPGGRGGGIRPAEGGMRYIANNCSIKTMITMAYRVKPETIESRVGKEGYKLTSHEAQNAHDPWIDITQESFCT
jgi:hypothetical protein